MSVYPYAFAPSDEHKSIVCGDCLLVNENSSAWPFIWYITCFNSNFSFMMQWEVGSFELSLVKIVDKFGTVPENVKKKIS
jgi:hypothetical protein